MKPFIPKKTKAVEWADRYHAIDMMKVIRKGYPTDEREKARLMAEERAGVERVNRLLRDISATGAKALHMAAYVIASMEDMAHRNKELETLLSMLPSDKSPSAAISELGMMLADLNEPVIDRIEAAMLNAPELFQKEWLNDPLQDFTEEFE